MTEKEKRDIAYKAIAAITGTDSPEAFARYNTDVFDVAKKVADILTEQPVKTYEEGYADGKKKVLSMLQKAQKLDLSDACEIIKQDFDNRLKKDALAENVRLLEGIVLNALYILGTLKENGELLPSESSTLEDKDCDSRENTPEENSQSNDTFLIVLNGKKIEFKSENEKNPNDPEHDFFTYEEALACQKDGWRLPTAAELNALRKDYPYKFDKENKQGIFNNQLFLPAAGYRDYDGTVYRVDSDGNYWSSVPYGPEYAWYLYFSSSEVCMLRDNRRFGQSVRLVRDIQ